VLSGVLKIVFLLEKILADKNNSEVPPGSGWFEDGSVSLMAHGAGGF